MRQTWTLFVSGLFLVLIVGVFLPKTRAEGEPTLPQRIEDPSLSGMKVEVPPASELEATIQKKEKDLQEKEARIAEANDRLAVEESRLKLRIAELEKLQQEIETKQQNNKVVDEQILAKMVKTFETMSPKKAAGVIATLSDELAVELLLKMKEKKLAAVMDVMDPLRATSLSTLMSDRRPAGKSVGEAGGAAKGSERGLSSKK